MAFRFYARMPNGMRGMLMMFVATMSAVSMHTLVRYVAQGLEPFEIAFFRNSLGLLFLAPLFLRTGTKALRTKRPFLHIIRNVLVTASMLSFFTALTITPLAQVTALSFTAPLFATLLAVLFLGEVVRLRRWAAIFVGFVGVFVLLRPGIAEFDLGSILTVFSAFCWGAAIMFTKKLSLQDSSLTITFYMAAIMTPLSFLPALWVWSWPTETQWFLLFAIAGFGTLTQMCFSQALRETETNVVMPIDFFKLIWAAAIGVIIFGEIPDLYTWIGGAMIFSSATYIAFRESKLKNASLRYQEVKPRN
ncbi:MAG: DMT family transporter [Alphaproteobacteria bacterium]|jgi:drug/metabolite transporter (DMT)-like permease